MDSKEILKSIVTALKEDLGDGYSSISGLVRSQGILLAKQAAHVSESRLNGSLKDNDELFDFFLEGLQRNAENLAKSVVMLSALTIEKAWNAIAGALWNAIRGALAGAGVPDGLLPVRPPVHV